MKQHPSWARSWRDERFCTPPCGTLTKSITWFTSSGEGQLLPVDVGIHKPNATKQLAWFPETSLQLGIRLHPSTLSPGPSARPRISQVASTSSSQADHAQLHGQQYPMHPPARPAPNIGGGFLEMLQSQPTEMVSNFLYVHFYMVTFIWSFIFGHFVMFAKCQLLTSLSSLGGIVLLKHR